MSKDAKNVPALRFKGYSDAWEKRKLGELAEFINGRAYKQDELLASGKYSVLRVGNFYTNDKWYYSNLELPEKYYAEEGDLLYTWSATFGPHIWIGPKVIYHYHIWKVALKNIFEKDFALQFFEADRVRLLNSTNGSTMIHVTKKDMESKGILLPDVCEQRTIGDLLKRVDHLIAATQHKIDALEQAKKALLQRLFDQSWRFKGYSDPWEKRKLGELMKVTSVKRVHQSDWRQEGVPFLRARDIVAINKNQKVKEPIYISRDLYERYSEQSGRVTPGDLLVTGVGSIGIPFLIKTESPIYFKDGNIIWFQNRTLDPAFFYFQFTGNSIQTYILSTSGKGTVGTFTIATGKQTPIVFPKKTEQKLIGSTMSDLDNLIAATQSRLSSLELLKKALLQDLFI